MSIRFENPLDASGTTNAKQTREGSANIAESNSSAEVEDADLSKFKSKIQKTKFASLEPYLVTLIPVKRDTIVKNITAIAKLRTSVKQKKLAVSKLIPNEDPTKSHIPVSLRRKDELKASKRGPRQRKVWPITDGSRGNLEYLQNSDDQNL